MAIDANKIFSDSFARLNKNSEKVNISLSSPLNPVFIFYLSKSTLNLHDEIYNDLRNVWGNSADTIGYFLVEVKEETYTISSIDGQELSESDFIAQASKSIEKFGAGYSKVHSYMFADTSDMNPETFEHLFKAGKNISEKLDYSISMLITILDESFGKEKNATEIRRKLKNLKEDAYSGTAVISNKCKDNSIVQVTPCNQEGFRDFNLLADIILLSNTKICNSKGETVSSGGFYNTNEFFTISYKNKSRPDKDRTAAVILEIVKALEEQMQIRKNPSDKKTDNWKKLSEKIKDQLVNFIYAKIASSFPKECDFTYIPLINRPTKKNSKDILTLPNHVANGFTGNATYDYYEMNYAAEIDSYFENTLREEDIRLKVREILSTQSFIDIARHFKPSDIDAWTDYASSQDVCILKVFEIKSKNRILGRLKSIAKKILLNEIEYAQGYINVCDKMISRLNDAVNSSVKIINIDKSIIDFYGKKADEEIGKRRDFYFEKFFSYVYKEKDLEDRMSDIFDKIVGSVYDSDINLFDADFTKEIILRNPGTHKDQINQQINTELTRGYDDKMALKINMAGKSEEIYKLFMLNDDSLKKCISGATTGNGFTLAFLNSGSNRFVEFVAVYSCDYEALIGG